ncbi:MAG: type II secretion system protein [Erysipelothrix sp.]|nr:type II secretion system protein [Erysipelothrix sp.]
MLNKGFTMIEALVVVLIVSLFNSLAFYNLKDQTFQNQVEVYKLSDKLVNLQIESLLLKEKNCLSKGQYTSKYSVCFNQHGNINMSQNLLLINNNLFITIFLGAGTHEVKQR